MAKYYVRGEIKITYSWFVDEEVEAENEDDAIDAVCEDLDPSDSYDSDTDAYSIKATEIEPPPEPSEAQRLRALGMPLLPGFE